jgi:endonuclease/exonuclease/phosphatase (EEP) superfamily protein YafD
VTRRRPALILVAWALALGAAGAGFASLGGGRSPTLDLLTHLAPLPLLAALTALALWLVAGRPGRLLPALALMALFPPAWLMGPEIAAALAPRPPIPPGAERIRVLQFNLWTRNADPKATIDYILAVDADVVLLQEAQGGAIPIVKALAARYPHTVSCYWGFHCDPRIMMKTPFLAKSRENPGAPEKDGDIGRVVWASTRTAKGATFTAVSTHYDWPGFLGDQEEDRRRFLRELKSVPGSLIVAGDFNSTPWSFGLRGQDRDIGLIRRTRAVFTWPAAFPLMPIDHLYAGPQWRTVSVERGPRLGSDHRPVLTTLAYVPVSP